jgi:hypothetical protein
MKAASDRIAAAKEKRRRLERARREALKDLGCESCGASKEEIRDEQHRLRREFYARQNTREPAAAGTGDGL